MPRWLNTRNVVLAIVITLVAIACVRSMGASERAGCTAAGCLR